MTIRVVVLNHKGGVGKTTLAFHLAHWLSETGHSVLCVDADAQCNLSTAFLGEKNLDQLLDKSEGEKGSTIWSLVQAGGKSVRALSVAERVHLVPGDVRMHRHEELLAAAWSGHRDSPTESIEFLTRLGRRVGFIEERVAAAYTIFDTAPSLGALNRSVVLDSDFLVVPLGLDLFSVRGLKTLGRALVEWMEAWDALTRFAPTDLLTRIGKPVLGGYVLQRVPQKTSSKTRAEIERVQSRIRSDFLKVIQRYEPRLGRGGEFDLRLGMIPEMSGLTAAQEHSQPIWKRDPSTRSVFSSIGDRLLTRVERMRGHV